MKLIAAIVGACMLFLVVQSQSDWKLEGVALTFSLTGPPDRKGLKLNIELIPRAADQPMPNQRRRLIPVDWLDPLEPPAPDHAR